MRIQSVAARTEAFELTRPYTIAFRSIDSVELGVVEIAGEGGLLGRGSASPEPHVTGETREAMATALGARSSGGGALDWLVGRDARHLPALARELDTRMAKEPAARAAVDMALHDLLAQALGVPLVEMLGRAHTALPTSITIGIKSVDETLEEAREYLGRGFRALKVKLGRSVDEDVERLHELRDRVPREVAVRVDPNQGYSATEVRAFAAATADLDIEFLEQPMPAEAVNEARSLPEAVRERLAADESLLTPADAFQLALPPRACGIFNIKLMKCGGVSAARRIADLADTTGIALMWGCMDESRISIAAALHAALASPATRYLDLDGHLDLARDVATGGFVIEDGLMRTTGEPGLGLGPP